MGEGEDLGGFGDGLVAWSWCRELVERDRRYRCTRVIVILEQLGVGGKIGAVKATR